MRKFISQDIRTLQAINASFAGSAAAKLGIEFTAVGPDFIVGEMPVDERTRQPYGLLHGGASVLMAETLGSLGSTLLISDEPDALPVGIEVSGSHVRGVREGRVTGVARPIRIGRTLHFWRVDVVDGQGRLCCAARLTVSIQRNA